MFRQGGLSWHRALLWCALGCLTLPLGMRSDGLCSASGPTGILLGVVLGSISCPAEFGARGLRTRSLRSGRQGHTLRGRLILHHLLHADVVVVLFLHPVLLAPHCCQLFPALLANGCRPVVVVAMVFLPRTWVLWHCQAL